MTIACIFVAIMAVRAGEWWALPCLVAAWMAYRFFDRAEVIGREMERRRPVP